ncbi:hypothetical protein COCSADRAFT_32897 [Bipolaris sorokiniana ND90Pr]|uniref:Uncharacterized protein n=1 Tax=Cochliobolus sativus (strain ND90Pr / ATCC 201652) TaxID=665912 RepID=M2TGS6_COCSN|nr:uncharacterized protein COCSADRAFT_32897 [Bipolaris sorokiniana ND90Pr]EMD67927.1 hypothetical protein COCSADRAFT_32897 [Bipolaris sorokiniana ND90Pr]
MCTAADRALVDFSSAVSSPPTPQGLAPPTSPHRNRTTTTKKNAHRDQKEEMADETIEED